MSRQAQLAKGAILSGFYALLKKAGRTMEDLDQVMIAGQFGAHLPAESLIGTRNITERSERQTDLCGKLFQNRSLSGIDVR